jgi:uncharacterized repeat protein (TIGR01451 family)
MGGHVRGRRTLIGCVLLTAAVLVTGAVAPAVHAEGPDAIVTDQGCLANELPRNDDGSTGAVPIGFPVNFFGTTNTHLFVNNNGNVTFDSSLGTFTPSGLTGATGTRIIAPFWADVDTRGLGSDIVRYSYGPITFNGRPAFCVNWVNVGYFSSGTNRLNSFQLLLVDRSDVGVGNFDIVFNYDKIQWEAGNASGGSGGLGGTSAAAGFSAGTGVDGTFFQQPGSLVNGALLDTNQNSGLIQNSRNTLQLGRYIFPVRNGAAPAGGTIGGTVFGPDEGRLENALVQVCPAGGGQCAFMTATNPNGEYIASGLPPGSYTVTAFPPADSSLSPDTEGPLNVAVGSDQTQNLNLTDPTPPPAGTTVGNSAPETIPVVVVGQAFDIVTTGCDGGSATYTITGNYGGSTSGPMVENPPGTYTANDVVLPFTGPAHVTLEIDGCPTIEFDIYIDPSGFVRTPSGNAIEGATVTLYRADSPAGPFVQVPDGSAIMSPANRSNPDLTDATGHFGWDTIAGYYKVRAEKTDCHAVGNPAQPYAETDVLPVPPPVTDIDLRLEGPGCAGDVMLTLTPETALNDLRTSHTVTAELRDGQGGPVGGAPIVFEVTGAHTQTGTATTGEDGKAGFTYTGVNRGTDSIRACVDANENDACDSNEVTGSAEKAWDELSGSADVGVTISASPDTVDPGQQVSFAVVATNHGPFRAPGTNVTVHLPANVSFASVSTSKGTCNGGSPTTCSLDTLAAGESASIGVVGTASAPGPGTAQADVSSASPDPNVGANNSATVGVTVTGEVEEEEEELPPPETGEGNGSPVAGTVLVNGQPVDGPVRLENGDTVDTTEGTLELETVNGTGQFAGGTFQFFDVPSAAVLRRAGMATAGAQELGVTEIRLAGGNFKRTCAAGGRKLSANEPPKKKTRVRSLWGNAKGSFRTRGRHSSATVRGTVWFTADRCDGTLTFVREGSVLVDDFALKRTRVVQAGKRYLAKPKRR